MGSFGFKNLHAETDFDPTGPDHIGTNTVAPFFAGYPFDDLLDRSFGGNGENVERWVTPQAAGRQGNEGPAAAPQSRDCGVRQIEESAGIIDHYISKYLRGGLGDGGQLDRRASGTAYRVHGPEFGFGLSDNRIHLFNIAQIQMHRCTLRALFGQVRRERFCGAGIILIGQHHIGAAFRKPPTYCGTKPAAAANNKRAALVKCPSHALLLPNTQTMSRGQINQQAFIYKWRMEMADAKWNLRFAPHLGVSSPDRPLFRWLAGDAGLASQIAFAASQGFAGVQYAWAASRPEEERAVVAEAAQRLGLELGVVAWCPRDVLRIPLWGHSGHGAWETIKPILERAMEAATSIGSQVIGVLGAADAETPIGPQQTAMAEHLKRAADLVSDRDLIIGIEPMVIIPNMLLKSCHDGLDVIEKVDHPAVRLIFDTAHVFDVDGDVAKALEDVVDQVCLVQIADQPGRSEPGAGVIDFETIFRTLLEREYTGLVELEHEWTSPGRETENAGLQRLRKFDVAAASSRKC